MNFVISCQPIVDNILKRTSVKWMVYLYNGDMEERTTKANDNWSSSHNCWPSEKSYSHCESSHCVPTCNYLRLKCHEQTYHQSISKSPMSQSIINIYTSSVGTRILTLWDLSRKSEWNTHLTLCVHLCRVGAKHGTMRHSQIHCWIRHYALTIYH